MITLKVAVNGKHLCSAGAEDLAVLNVIVGALGNLGNRTKRVRNELPDISLRVSGLTSREADPDEHLNWVELFELTPSDIVTIEILEADNADCPIRSWPIRQQA